MKLIKTASGKKQIKISRKEWEAIGKKAGWVEEIARTHVELTKEKLKKSIGEEGLCSISGDKTTIAGLTVDRNADRNISIFDFINDWGAEGYGIALISPDDKVVDPYIDSSDYPDMVLDKSGNGTKVVSKKHKDYYIIFHSGQLENKVGEEWFPEHIDKHTEHQPPSSERCETHLNTI